MTRTIARRLGHLERIQPARPDVLTPHALERMTYAELAEIKALFVAHGDVEVEDLPHEAQARIHALVEIASKRRDPVPIKSAEHLYNPDTGIYTPPSARSLT